jgi:hypothetical protein
MKKFISSTSSTQWKRFSHQTAHETQKSFDLVNPRTEIGTVPERAAVVLPTQLNLTKFFQLPMEQKPKMQKVLEPKVVFTTSFSSPPKVHGQIWGSANTELGTAAHKKFQKKSHPLLTQQDFSPSIGPA